MKGRVKRSLLHVTVGDRVQGLPCACHGSLSASGVGAAGGDRLWTCKDALPILVNKSVIKAL